MGYRLERMEYTIRKYYFTFVCTDAESVLWNRPLTLCIMVSAEKKNNHTAN